MKTNRSNKNLFKLLAASAASAASMAVVSSAVAQSNVDPTQVVISASGSTALKNWIAKTPTFTDVTPNTTLDLGGNVYPPTSDGGSSYWTSGGRSYQVAPSTNTTIIDGGPADQSAAAQFIYHESGSVEGILEMANDQLYTNADFAGNSSIPETSIIYVTENVDRNPEGGNAIFLNENQIGNDGNTAGKGFNATTGSAAIGTTTLGIGNFYASGVGQAATPGTNMSTIWTPGSASNPLPTFSTPTTGLMAGAGVNVNGGQNAVQFALSDAIPEQVFQNDYSNPSTVNTSFNSTPQNYGYGQGNPALAAGSLGTAGSRASYQSASVLDVSATAQNPRAAAGVDFGAGPWTNASDGGLGNLNSQLTAVTATAFVANPGTGLSELNRTDADWLQMTGRLSNGAGFNVTTRDVNSGTRNVAALDTGIDPTYASGKDDDGNGNLTNGVTTSVFDQESIGPAQRFSNKTAGGAQLRPTVQNNRMALGTLSINDAGGNDEQSNANPVAVLSYADTNSGYANAVSPNYATISNGTYVIYQNEQVVTIKNMSSVAAYNASGVTTLGNGEQELTGTIQGDDNNGDVVNLLNNTADSIITSTVNTSPASPADGLLSQGYIIPSLMQVSKAYNGQGLIQGAAGTIDTGSIQSTSNLPADGGSFDQSYYNTWTAAGGYAQSKLPVLAGHQPTTGTGSFYGGAGGDTYAHNYFNGGSGDTVGNASGIAIDNNNYIFGNFNQNGVRDLSAVESALPADEALIGADIAAGATVPGSEFTTAGDSNGVGGGHNGLGFDTSDITYTDSLGVTHTNLSKGDLIVMGDYTGDGHFDGADLVAMAENCALSDSTSTNTLTVGATMYQSGVLRKNAAMDYMNSNVPEPGTVGANATTDYIRSSGAAILEGSAVPFGATAVTNLVTGLPVVDPVSGLKEFSYDPTGVNTFNKSDVNQDGVVDFNDAVQVDNENGQDYSNIAEQVAATMPAPVTGATVPFNLTMAKLSDGSSVINGSDVAVVNAALTGVGNTNWYNGVPLVKTGPSNITWARTGGTVTVYPGASFDIKAGTVQVGGTEDPFTDNNAPGTGSTAGNHVAVTVDGGAKLQITQSFSTLTVASLNVNTLANSSVDIGTNALIIDYSSPATDPIASIEQWIKDGYAGGAWDGPGINSSAIASADAATGLSYGIGYADSADPGDPAGLPSGEIEVKFTLLGDANLDGIVNAEDFTPFSQNQGASGAVWDQGDFNYDGTVNAEDFTPFSANLGQSVGAGPLASASGISSLTSVPEPASVGLMVAAGLGILSRRRRAARPVMKS